VSALERRLLALERAVNAPQAGGLTEADKALLHRSLPVLLAHAPGTDAESFGDRLAHGMPTGADLDLLRQLAQAGQSDPAGFVRRVADLSRSV
jgi:hypothetical protein